MIKNLVFIAVDDLRPELNCFGKKKLHTPNIDALAEKSVRYEQAYCNFPQCMPSRASLLSGMRPKKFCNWSNQLCTTGEVTLPGWMKQNGFTTISAGKLYHEPLDDAFSWDELHMDTFMFKSHGGMTQWFHDYQDPQNQQLTRDKQKLSMEEIKNNWQNLPPISECVDAPEEDYVDAQVASRAVECIHRHADDEKPVFLSVGFYRPHLPWVAPKKYWDLYDREEVNLADNPFFPENGVGKSNLCDFMHYGEKEIQETYTDLGRYQDDDFPVLSEEKQRECVHAYWAAVSFMDAQVGRVLTALEESGLAENTAIVFWGDNGWHLGEHKLWSKITNFDESTRVPLMVSVPGVTKGEQCDSVVESVDIYPTCCDLLGLEKPQHLEGQTLPALGAYGNDSREGHAFVGNHNGLTLVNDRYRLTYYQRSSEELPKTMFKGRGHYELFDHQTDPDENVNVAGDPQYADVLETMKRQLFRCYEID